MSTSKFAMQQLEKQGWKKGSGLGKDESGMTDPIKVNLKMDKTGVGHDPGKEFTDHWWLRVFNDAAKKIGNGKQAKTDPVKQKTEEKMDRKKSFYAGFVKSSTLTNGVEEKVERSDSSSEEENDPNERVPTLEDIHKFCGGATGHKAARFGIKMGGKLARVAKHDQIVAARIQQSENMDAKSDDNSAPSTALSSDKLANGSDSSTERTETDKRKKRKKKSKKSDRLSGSDNIVLNLDGAKEVVEDETSGVKRKKKSKKSDKVSDFASNVKDTQETTEVNNSLIELDVRKEEEAVEDETSDVKKKKKSKKSDKLGDFESNVEVTQEEMTEPISEVSNSCIELDVAKEEGGVDVKRKKKSKKSDKASDSDSNVAEPEVAHEETTETVTANRKKRKKNKNSDNVSDVNGDSTVMEDSYTGGVEDGTDSIKKKRKKNKRKSLENESQAEEEQDKPHTEEEVAVKKRKKETLTDSLPGADGASKCKKNKKIVNENTTPEEVVSVKEKKKKKKSKTKEASL